MVAPLPRLSTVVLSICLREVRSVRCAHVHAWAVAWPTPGHGTHGDRHPGRPVNKGRGATSRSWQPVLLSGPFHSCRRCRIIYTYGFRLTRPGRGVGGVAVSHTHSLYRSWFSQPHLDTIVSLSFLLFCPAARVVFLQIPQTARVFRSCVSLVTALKLFSPDIFHSSQTRGETKACLSFSRVFDLISCRASRAQSHCHSFILGFGNSIP